MKRIYIVFLFALSVITSCDENQLVPGGTVTPATFEIVVVGDDGNAVSGATVDLFTTRKDWGHGVPEATKTTDANGSAVFNKAELAEAGIHYFSVKSGDLRNWDGVISKSLLVNNGDAQITTAVDDVSLSTGISGPTFIYSGIEASFSLKNYPGAYAWSISGNKTTIDDASDNEITISFDANDVDQEVTLTVSATPDGFTETIYSLDILIGAYCPIDIQIVDGPLSGGDITFDGQGWPAWDSQVVATKTGDNSVIQVTGLGFGWMSDFWGEEIITSKVVDMEVDELGLNITIPEQTYLTTLYNGEEQDPYTIQGTGVIDGCSGKITIEYELTNFGTGWGNWCYENGYMSDKLFTAVLDIP